PAGFGQAAREHASQAAQMEAASAYALQTLGLVLTHDLLGRKFHKGFDYDGAQAAYRRAAELDPANPSARLDLAILLEHDPDGNRYSRKAQLEEAIAQYRKVREQFGSSEQLDNNLLFAL